MTVDSHGLDAEPPYEAPRVGRYDAQLSLPVPFVEEPLLIKSVIKRDGREVPFEKAKIAEAIFKAAQSVGGDDRDRAASLATAVMIYLSRTLEDATPTVDQIHDAVEKVLIEMGHARTALAYARYRDRRARLRKLREGDVAGLLREIGETAREGAAIEASLLRPVCVRTSDERLAGWDLERIVAVLARETGLAEGLARVIALEVEDQIRKANVRTLTAALVRELVGAKLIEHGLEEHHRKQMRIGVPLYDAERIICAPNQGESEAAQDPITTDRLLAERVKREYALTQVYSQQTTDAHRSGELHLRDLHRVDRLVRCAHSLEFVKRFGFPANSGAAIQAESAIAFAARCNAAMGRVFAQGGSWPAINVYLAPLVDADRDAPRRVAQALVYLILSPSRTPPEPWPPTELGLNWNVPEALQDVDAIGPGGEPVAKGYGAYEGMARQLALEILDVLKGTHAINEPEHGLRLRLHVSAETLESPEFRVLAMAALDKAETRGRVAFEFERGPVADVVPHRYSWQPHEVVAHHVSVNLPRAVYRAGGESGLGAALERVAHLAVQAHVEKREFIRRLLSLRDVGPLGLLTFAHGGRSYVDPDRAAFEIGVSGLNECVQNLCGEELGESARAVDAAVRVLEQLREAAASAADSREMRVKLVPDDDASVARRFATLDLQHYPDRTRRVVKVDSMTRDIGYTAGVRPGPGRGQSPFERLRAEALFHDYVDAGTVQVSFGDRDAGARAVFEFLEKTYSQTRARAIRFGASL